MRFWLAAIAMSGLQAQEPRAMFTATEMSGHTERMLQLMESVSVAIPDLARAASPVTEYARQAREEIIRAPGGQSAPPTYGMLTNARAYLALADALPKPFPFPAVAQKQLDELRDAVNRLDASFQALMEQRETALRNPDRDNTKRYEEANSRATQPAAAKPRVVFIGDSITDAWRLNEYFPDRDFVNRGISGQVTSEMLARMKQDVLNLKPQAMVVLAGTNDLARGTSLHVIQNNLTMMCDLAEKHGIKVILSSVLPIHDYNVNVNPSNLRSKQRPPDQIRSLNIWIETFAQNRRFTYLNYFNAMVDSAGCLRKDLAEDGLHPNAMGYRIMAPLVERAIAATLAKPATSSSKRSR